jgi:uncharacterized protein YjbJ (UPF0337 family)
VNPRDGAAGRRSARARPAGRSFFGREFFNPNVTSLEFSMMNRDTMEGKWKQLKGKVKAAWSELTDDEVQQIEGKREQLVGKIQEKYGQTKEQIEEQLAKYEHDCGCA